MQKIEAQVVRPASVSIDVEEGLPLRIIRKKILEEAEKVWESGGVKAIIIASNMEELVE